MIPSELLTEPRKQTAQTTLGRHRSVPSTVHSSLLVSLRHSLSPHRLSSNFLMPSNPNNILSCLNSLEFEGLVVPTLLLAPRDDIIYR